MAGNYGADINAGEDDDEALRLAIALSLGKDPNSAIDLTQDDEDNDLLEVAPASAAPAAPVAPVAPPPVSSLSALGLDRRKMEEERLARANKKRKASEYEGPAPGLSSRPEQRQKTEAHTPASSSKPLASLTQAAPRTPAALSTLSLPYPHGVVKKTWVSGMPRSGDDIKIEEVLQKDKLELAVVSSYQWDQDWLLSKIDIDRTKLVIIIFAVDEAQQEQMRANMPPNRVRFCFPPMGAYGSMHSKLQLLGYENYLRIVVPTGNMVSYDWGETGVQENMVFIIDLPKLETEERQKTQQLTPFAEDLILFLSAQGLDGKLLSSLRKYDFSKTSRYGFVHTIAGSQSSGDAWKRTGYCGLGRAVSALGLGSGGVIDVDYATASLGNLSYDLLRGLYYACQGDSGLKEYQGRMAGRKGKLGDDVDTLNDHFRVYFPSAETIKKCRGGKDSAGTICFNSKWHSAPEFPRRVLRDSSSTREGILIHSKVMYVQTSEGTGFAYVGSANLSESAWGRLVKNRGANKPPKLTCRNWECGVLIPVSPLRTLSSGESVKGLGMFAGRVPVPMQVPAPPLTEGGNRDPWFYQG